MDYARHFLHFSSELGLLNGVNLQSPTTSIQWQWWLWAQAWASMPTSVSS